MESFFGGVILILGQIRIMLHIQGLGSLCPDSRRSFLSWIQVLEFRFGLE